MTYDPLHHDLRQAHAHEWETFLSVVKKHPQDISPEHLKNYQQAALLSPWVMSNLLKDIDFYLSQLIQTNPFDFSVTQLAEHLTQELNPCNNDILAKAILRLWRHRFFTLVAIRNTLPKHNFEQELDDISSGADQLILSAYEWLYPRFCQQWGTPKNQHDDMMHLVILAMGKYGGKELNFSSDVDLIFFYEADGKTNSQRQLEYHTFFVRFGQQLITLLADITEHGCCFRIDMRLRPYGDGGPLAMSFASAEDYYQHQGREWERFALIKARPITGSEEEKKQLYRLLRPFVFRRYIDFGVLEAIRQMKQLIEQDVRKQSLQSDIKLGAGGIREAEFIVQALQLIRGGQKTELQESSFLKALETLLHLHIYPKKDVESLRQAYLFLRRIEHRLQMLHDRQTQQLPTQSLAQIRVAQALSFSDWQDCEKSIEQARHTIKKQFHQLFRPAYKDNEQKTSHYSSITDINHLFSTQSLSSYFKTLSAEDIDHIHEVLNQFFQGQTYQSMSIKGQNRLHNVLPLLMPEIAKYPQPLETLKRLLHLFRAIARRSAYLVLIIENPPILEHLVKLFSQSIWISEQLSQLPLLLDELLFPNSLYHPLSDHALQQELERHFLRIDPNDEEQQLEALQHFKQTNELRVAAAFLNHPMDIRQTSLMLSTIAQTIIQKIGFLCWQQICTKHGVPHIESASIHEMTGFAIIAYGKLGGEEFGFGSDLDLIFLYRGDPDTLTQGTHPVSHYQFFTRLAQKIIHRLNTRGLSGVLYTVDTRLRPSGQSGHLISHIDAFAQYQQESAWTWEHQALIRARCLCGDDHLQTRFSQIRHQQIGKTRLKASLKEEVKTMRQKMRDNLDTSNHDHFDVKQGPGGLVDIEFLIQFLVLQQAADYPQISWSTRTTELIEQLVSLKVLSNTAGIELIDAYRHYRRLTNLQRLTQSQSTSTYSQNYDKNKQEYRETIIKHWHTWLGKSDTE